MRAIAQKKPFYLVAVPEGNGAVAIKRLQKQISSYFDMYSEPFPALHITLAIIEQDPRITASYPLIGAIARDALPFTLDITGARCFDAPNFSVGLGVSSPYLSHLAGWLEGALSKEGFAPRSMADWLFHIHLIHPLFASRVWSPQEYRQACDMAEKFSPCASITIRRLELWSPQFPPLQILANFS